jgi:hypothetical protein
MYRSLFESEMKKRIGKKHGRIVPVEIEYDGNMPLYKCQCVCGNTVSIQTGLLECGYGWGGCGEFECYTRTKREHTRIQKQKVLGLQNPLTTTIYHSYRAGAERRGYTFNLPINDFEKLILSDCHYCGSPPKNHRSQIMGSRMEEILYSGIDRKDNNRGYEFDNVVPCCFICNRAKSTKDYLEFIFTRSIPSCASEYSPLRNLPHASYLSTRAFQRQPL